MTTGGVVVVLVRIASVLTLVTLGNVVPVTAQEFAQTVADGRVREFTSISNASQALCIFYQARAGRSYSVEAWISSKNYVAGSLTVNLNTSCTTSDIAGLRDTAAIEPAPQQLSFPSLFYRVSLTASVSQSLFLRVVNATANPVTVEVKVSETTLFSNWFFIGGDYGAYTIIRNTTSSSVGYTVNWRDSAGTIRGTVSGTLAGDGSTFVNARDHVNALLFSSGTVEILTDTTPGAIVASTTVLSGTTGLSFDAPFSTRP